MFLSAIGFAQKNPNDWSAHCYPKEFDFDQNGLSDSIFFNKTRSLLFIVFDSKETQKVVIPAILGYENIKLFHYGKNIINLQYSSSHVSTINLLLSYNIIANEWTIIHGTLYAPCQTCESGEKRTCEKSFNLELSVFINNYEENLVDEISYGSCRTLYNEGLEMEFKDVYAYYKKIQKLEPATAKNEIDNFLITNPISKENVQKYNDIAFFLEQAGSYEEAAFILEKVIEKFPDRIVAYINLGDSYWGLEEQQKAKKAYQTYISLMKKSGKEARIPKRVYERVQ